MTANQILDIAVSLLGEADNGEEERYDIDGFRRSAVGMINVLSAQLDELDCILKRIRPDADNRLPALVRNLEDEVRLHPWICRSVLPLGLCYMLLLEENAARAAHFLRAYESEQAALRKRFNRPRRHPIRNIYGKI